MTALTYAICETCPCFNFETEFCQVNGELKTHVSLYAGQGERVLYFATQKTECPITTIKLKTGGIIVPDLGQGDAGQ